MFIFVTLTLLHSVHRDIKRIRVRMGCEHHTHTITQASIWTRLLLSIVFVFVLECEMCSFCVAMDVFSCDIRDIDVVYPMPKLQITGYYQSHIYAWNGITKETIVYTLITSASASSSRDEIVNLWPTWIDMQITDAHIHHSHQRQQKRSDDNH